MKAVWVNAESLSPNLGLYRFVPYVLCVVLHGGEIDPTLPNSFDTNNAIVKTLI